MDDTDIIVEVVDHTVDRPEFSDRGDQPSVIDDIPTVTVVPVPEEKKKPKRKTTQEELWNDAGVDPIFSTSEAAEFFDRSNQWLYWGLREGVFTHADGTLIEPERIGHPVRGRRRFTIPIIKEIMKSSYRRGNLGPEQLKTIMRRVRYAQEGVEWREREGWKYIHLSRNRYRWVRPELVEKDSKGNWVVKPGVKLRQND